MPTPVELNSEPFASVPADWSWKTPGAGAAATAWSHSENGTGTPSAGPDGGADPATRAVSQGNGYAFTEASDSDGPWTMDSPAFDASSGRLELTFDLHLRFGDEGRIDDGVLAVQGWNGAAWKPIGAKIRGSKQSRATDPYKPSKDFGTYDSRGFDNDDFKFRLVFTKGSSAFPANYDCAVDNLSILRHEDAVEEPLVVTPALNARRTIWVDPVNGKDSASGFKEDKAKATLKAALSLAKGGDLIRVKDGVFFGRHELRNKDSAAGKPIWIRAENPGKVVITNRWQQAFNKSVDWKPAGGGVFKATSPSGDGPFMGSYVDGQGVERFLFRYRTKDDITRNPLHVEQRVLPDMNVKHAACGFAKSGNQVFIRLRNGANPKNASIRLTKSFAQNLLVINRSQRVIIDGILFEGSGECRCDRLHAQR